MGDKNVVAKVVLEAGTELLVNNTLFKLNSDTIVLCQLDQNSVKKVEETEVSEDTTTVGVEVKSGSLEGTESTEEKPTPEVETDESETEVPLEAPILNPEQPQV